MKQPLRLDRILWAVDPFEESTESLDVTFRLIRSLRERSGGVVLPVSVLGLAEGLLPNTALYSDPTFLPTAREAAEQSLRDLFSEGRPDWVVEPRLLSASPETLSVTVDILLAEARRSSSDLIVTRSHGRQGFARFLGGGSFAETLVERSPQPVLVLGGHATEPGDLSHVLFPTDFGEKSRAAFRWLLEWAKITHSKVTLFHALSPPEDFGLDFESSDRLIDVKGESLTFRQAVERESERQTRRAAAWAERGAGEGVETDFIIDDSGADLETILLDVGRRTRCDLVLMESHDHPLRTAWLGSRSRDVLRSAECPVLLLPAKFLTDWTKPRPELRPEPSPAP